METARLTPRPHSDPLPDALFPGAPDAVDWGLGRMRAALAELGDPHRRYRSLHVGGTNGKGSVAATWASVLRRDGERTGLYTSPHLCSFRERIVVDGGPLSAHRLLEAAARLRPLALDLRMSLFEACTLLALVLFAEEEVGTACVEVGLGGRLDATNVIEPEVTAITNVALDHREHLGDSLEGIAREKAGIVKAGVPVVTAERRPEALSVLEAKAREVGAPFHRVEPGRHISRLRPGRGGARFELLGGDGGPLELETPLPGTHQAANAALAARALQLLPRAPSPEALRAGVAAVRWLGRGQVRRLGGSRFVLDVAHNPAAVRALAAILADSAPPRPLVVLVGILADKDWPRMLPPLAALADRMVLTTPDSAPPERRWDPHAAAAGVWGAAPVEVVDGVRAAVGRAVALAGEGTVVVTGSCHTVGDALRILGASPFGCD